MYLMKIGDAESVAARTECLDLPKSESMIAIQSINDPQGITNVRVSNSKR